MIEEEDDKAEYKFISKNIEHWNDGCRKSMKTIGNNDVTKSCEEFEKAIKDNCEVI